MAKKIQNHVFVLFGATGDLAKKKIIPALCMLHSKGAARKAFPLACVGRRAMTRDEYLEFLETDKNLKGVDKKQLEEFLQTIHYIKTDYADDFCTLHKEIEEIGRRHGCKGNRIFYLATPASLFEQITQHIKSCGMLKVKGFKRVIYEKPFGYDLSSSRKINKCVTSVFDEKDIYRIDHFLGKEIVQDIITLRFANSLFEQVWNNNFVDNVQILVPETTGVGKRAGYYEQAGAVRDMVQNHMLQILSLVAMEAPISMSADDIRDKKVEVLRSLQKAGKDDVVAGQYKKGLVNGKNVPGYTQEGGVAKDSRTETFAALKVSIRNKRWQGVPFYILTGKRLKSDRKVVNIVLKDMICMTYFGKECRHNVITIHIHPDEGISILFNAKRPGEMSIIPLKMEFCRSCEFGPQAQQAYEKLLFEVMLGNQTLFTRWDEVEAAWKFCDPLQNIIKAKSKGFPNYKAGTHGPKEAEELLRRDGREWLRA